MSNLAKGRWAVIMSKHQWRRRRAQNECADSHEKWDGEDSGGDSDHEEELLEEEDEKDLGENA
ncbi:hypothetical protein HOY80DRAFT_1052726 [Tuber brumale]|nr:hypothetical protein HOY80DRAFT_1052726 [Tuber brumale]